MSDAFQDWARVARERDAAVAEVTRLREALETMVLWLNGPEDNPIIQQARAALEGDGT